MKLFDRLHTYLDDEEYKITVYKDRVHILNYVQIDDFSSKKIKVSYKGGSSVIVGSDLVVSKMEDNEVLILGKIDDIQV